MPSNMFGMNFEEAQQIHGQLISATNDTQGGIPYLLQTDQALQGAIDQVMRAASQLTDALDKLKRVQAEHVQASINTVQTSLKRLPGAMQGDPSMALDSTLTTWNTHGQNIMTELGDVITKGSPIEAQLGAWSMQPSGALPQLMQAVLTLKDSLTKMTSSLETTHTGLKRHIDATSGVAEAGRSDMSVF